MVIDTTLLSSPTKLVYGPGCGSAGDGEPALNATDHAFYFTGRSDGFESTRPSTDPGNARFDTESIRVSNDGHDVYISDEYGPYVYEFNRATGRRERAFTLPDMFAVSTLSPVGNDEIVMNGSGRVANKGMEALAITPDGRTLVGAMQSPLLQDGGTVSGQTIRLVRIDLASGRIQQFAYKLDTLKTTVSDIVAVNSHEFLVDERDSKGLADDSQAVIKKIYKIDLDGAQDVSTTVGASNLAAKAVPKQIFLDVVAVLTGVGMNPFDIPAKLEGLAFGQDVILSGKAVHTLYLANDNDYSATVKNAHGTTTSNPNRFFVFAFSDADLPNFVPQQFKLDVDDDPSGR
jgi:hypothetical protein